MLIVVVATSGGATALLVLPEIVFGNTMLALLGHFARWPPRRVHGWVARALFLVIKFHLIGVLFHQIRLMDRRLSRIWFGSGSLVQYRNGITS